MTNYMYVSTVPRCLDICIIYIWYKVQTHTNHTFLLATDDLMNAAA